MDQVEKVKNVRISGWIEPDLQKDVQEEADQHSKTTGVAISFNQMMQILLRQAVKERRRLREKAEKRKDKSKQE